MLNFTPHVILYVKASFKFETVSGLENKLLSTIPIGFLASISESRPNLVVVINPYGEADAWKR